MPEYACHYLALVETLAVLDRDVDTSDLLDSCYQPAVFSTGVQRKRPGQDVEVWTVLCEDHDRLVQGRPDHIRSNRMRQPKPDPSP